ncbi:MAG: S8 family serine peptidase [Acidobacteriota bacterium]|jgi:subtilisin family serine protease
MRGRFALALLLLGCPVHALASGALPPSLELAAAQGVGEVECLVVVRSADEGGGLVGRALRAPAVAALRQEVAALGGLEGHRFEHLPLVHLRLPAAGLAQLAASPLVDGVAPVRLARALRSEGTRLMNVPAVAAQGLTGQGVGIAILDTGVDAGHSELSPKGTGASAKTVSLFDAIDNDGDPHDEEGHGTAVAGIAAGSGNGVAPGAKVVAVRVLDRQGEGTSVQMLAGIDAVLASINAGNPHNIKVLNMSLGGYDDKDWPPKAGTCDAESPDFAAAFRALEEAGVLVVVSAGNGGCTGGVAWPACLSRALAVGAVFDDEICALSLPLIGCVDYNRSYGEGQCMRSGCSIRTRPDRIACYSDSGEKLGVWAPAACAKTTRRGGGSEDCFDGTSAAAPYVAGVAALLTQAHPGRPPALLRQLLADTGKAIRDDRNGVTRNRVDAAQALAALATACAPAAPPTGVGSDISALCGRQPLTLSWTAAGGAAGYRVAWATSPDFSDATETAVSGTSWVFTPSMTADVTLYFRVAAVSACGAPSAWSPPVQVAYTAACQGLEQVYVVPGIAGNHLGVGGVVWSSDLSVLNPGAQPATVRLTLVTAGGEVEKVVTLGAGRQLTARQVTSSLFEIGGSAVGFVVVESDRPLEVLGRTYARGEAGGVVTSYGQAIVGTAVAEALGGAQVGLLPHLRSDGAFRTNLEFVNVGQGPARVTVRLVGDDGTTVATLDLGEVPPRGRLQRTRALPAGVASAWAEVRVQPAEARVVGYASVVDGSTDDPTTIPLRVRQ